MYLINKSVQQPTSSIVQILFEVNFTQDLTTLTPALAISTHNLHFPVFAIFVVKEVSKISGGILKTFKSCLSFLPLFSVRHLASLTTRKPARSTWPLLFRAPSQTNPQGREAGSLWSKYQLNVSLRVECYWPFRQVSAEIRSPGLEAPSVYAW